MPTSNYVKGARIFILTYVIKFIVLLLSSDDTVNWLPLAPGLDFRIMKTKTQSSYGNSQITVVRVDPNLWELVFVGISQTGEVSGKTAREWCNSYKLSATINAGMFNADYKTHTGYLRNKDHLNNANQNNYQSVAAFNPNKDKGFPPFRIFDLDAPGVTLQTILKDYSTAIQNL